MNSIFCLPLSTSFVCDELSDSFMEFVHGLRSNSQKVPASIIGTANIINIVLNGVTPYEIKAAYEKLPKIPAPPVPEDHVDMTFLIVRY